MGYRGGDGSSCQFILRIYAHSQRRRTLSRTRDGHSTEKPNPPFLTSLRPLGRARGEKDTFDGGLNRLEFASELIQTRGEYA